MLERVVPDWKLSEALGNINEGSTSCDLFNIEIPVGIEQFKSQESYEIYTDIEEDQLRYYQKSMPLAQNSSYYKSPSKEESALVGVQFEEMRCFGQSLDIKTKDFQLLGNTLHQLMYLKDQPHFEKAVANMGLLDELGVDRALFIGSVKKFNDYIQETFSPINQYAEIPLEMEIEGKLYTGEADLVLELENELILVDYKSYAGPSSFITNTSSDYYVGKYLGQLNIYNTMLNDYFDGKKVSKMIVYYLIQGKVLSIK